MEFPTPIDLSSPLTILGVLDGIFPQILIEDSVNKQ